MHMSSPTGKIRCATTTYGLNYLALIKVMDKTVWQKQK